MRLFRSGKEATFGSRTTAMPGPPCGENDAVGRAAAPFVQNSMNFVAGLTKQRRGPGAEVLVEFELHAALLPGRSTKRSRLISAP